MKKLTLALYGILALQFSACSFDKTNARNDQDKSAQDEKVRNDQEVIAIAGTYEGNLIIQGKPYEMIMTVSLAPNTDPKSTKSVVTAQVKRTDAILPTPSYMTGTYIVHGDLQLANNQTKEKISIYETSSINAHVEGEHLIGNLSAAGSILGNFDVVRTSTASNLELIEPCDPFYQNIRKKVESLTGTYEFTRRPIGWAPYTTDIYIQSDRFLSMKAVNSDPMASLTSILDVTYVSYVGDGYLILVTAAGSTEKELLEIRLDRQPGERIAFKGRFTSSTGRAGTAELEKVADGAPFCAGETKTPAKK